MRWQTHEAIESLIIGDVVIGSVFQWGPTVVAALDGKAIKTARSKEQGRAYIEKHAITHHKELCAELHAENGAEYVPIYSDLNARDDAENRKQRAFAALKF